MSRQNQSSTTDKAPVQAVRHGWLITIEDGFSLSDEAVREFAGFLKSIAVRSPNEYKEENAAHLDGHPGEPLHHAANQ